MKTGRVSNRRARGAGEMGMGEGEKVACKERGESRARPHKWSVTFSNTQPSVPLLMIEFLFQTGLTVVSSFKLCTQAKPVAKFSSLGVKEELSSRLIHHLKNEFQS